MKHYWKTSCAVAIIMHLSVSNLYPHSGPFDGQTFKGRIAYSADGNYNDEDDWGASPVALAIFAECGVKDKLVHFDYNCILPKTDPQWEKIHETSVLGAAERYGYRKSVFYNCQKDREGAIENIKNSINECSADNPLYFILAGPMEVPYLGIQKSDPAKRQFVYCISHSRWNDGYTTRADNLMTHNKRDVIPQGIKWVQITDQNQFLSTSRYGRPAKPDEWRPWYWMRNSNDSKVRFLWERLLAVTRADCSDSGMAYFLMTGDERSEISKVRKLLDDNIVPAPTDPREHIRIEAENFLTLDNYDVEHRNDRSVSHRINVKLASIITIDEVKVNAGDEIMVEVRGDAGEYGKLDYVQLNVSSSGSEVTGSSKSTFSACGSLDDPDALPGQVIVAGSNPGYLKYNGGGPVFLSGPDNPEDFLFRGTLNADGTRSGGGQEEMIDRMARAGVNAFHCQMTRMKRCNFKDEGDDTHTPFLNHDPSQGLDEDVLNQWDRWLGRFEENGIIVHLEFYNDATDVEMMGWKLDSEGNLPRDEKRWIEGVVKKFKHHKNILWGIEESCNKLPASRTPHFKKIGELIAKTDNYNHPIVQSFVVTNDPEGDFPADGITSDDYVGDPYIRVVTWLHVVPHGDDFERQHQEYLSYYKRDASKFVVMKNETYHHPRRGRQSRIYMWSCAMTGMHALEAYHHADRASDENTLRDDGRINTFMEQTDFYKMKPRDDLAAGSTRWVLANPGESYIAYTYDYSGPMGVKGITAGSYDLKWFDTVDGDIVSQTGISVPSGNVTWTKPDSIGNEVALYIKRQDYRAVSNK
jgi:hypothetical protein